MQPATTHKRVLLKLSGEALMGEQGYGIDPAVLQRIAGEVAAAHGQGTQLAIVWSSSVPWPSLMLLSLPRK